MRKQLPVGLLVWVVVWVGGAIPLSIADPTAVLGSDRPSLPWPAITPTKSSVGPVEAFTSSFAGLDWVLARESPSPPASRINALAYDSSRRRIVMFGGEHASGPFVETWEWDGTSWGRATSAATMPNHRGGCAIAYDTARARIVLFGGYYSYDDSGRHYLSDTWEWNGVDWVRAVTATSPPPRSFHAMAYDSTRERVVLFGGRGEAGALADTWEWDGSTWTERTATAGPSSRYGHAVAYDGARGRVVLFGGLGDAGALDDMWEWDGSTWTKGSSGGSPPARFLHAMAYDTKRRCVLLFGGDGISGPLQDTWEWNGDVWRPRNTPVSPPARETPGMAYDSERGRMVLAGGGGLADTWEWDGNAWHDRSATAIPPARVAPGLVYDAKRGRVVLFGGLGSTGPLADTWEWDGRAWVEKTPAESPPGRGYHAMAYDSGRGRVVLFGGWGSSGPLADTWEWNGIAWMDRTAAVGPTSRYGHAMAYDSGQDRVVVFGGCREDGECRPLADTWEWDGSTWTLMAPVSIPPTRAFHAMAYDGARRRVVLFAGMTESEYLGDTWEWDGSNWLEMTPDTSPYRRAGHAMAYDDTRERVLLFENGELWEWDGNTWAQARPPSTPAARQNVGLAYDAARQRLVLFGGTDVSDTWEYAPVAACARAGGVIEFTPGDSGSASAMGALGFPDGEVVSLGVGGRIVLSMDPPIQSGPGADFVVYSRGRNSQDVNEYFRVEVSEDDLSYFFARDCPEDGCPVDLAATRLASARYVRITDLASRPCYPFDELACGADIDACLASLGPSVDLDDMPDSCDNCPAIYNPDQSNVCDAASLLASSNLSTDGFSAERVDGRDLFVFASTYALCPGDPGYNGLANLDRVPTGSGACVDAEDLHLFLNEFGKSR